MCKRNRNANKESLKPHEYQIRKPIGVFTKIKCLKTENLQTGMNSKTEKPKIPVFPPMHLFVYQIDYSTREANI